MSSCLWIEDLVADPIRRDGTLHSMNHSIRSFVHESPLPMIRSLVGGSLLLPGIVSELLAADDSPADADPLAPKPPHFAPRAKRVIFLNMSGGVSHVDSFDYKPKLIADHNKPFQVPQRDAGGVRAEQPRRREVLQAAAVGVQAARPVGPVDQRPVSARRRVRRRPVPDPLDAQRPHRPLPGDARHPHRLGHVRRGRASARG